MSDPRILTVRPEQGEYAWTFGGAPPVARIAPGTILDLFTEDCFAGRVRSEKDLVSEVCDTNYTCVAKLRKEWLPTRESHRGIDARLRETAAALCD